MIGKNVIKLNEEKTNILSIGITWLQGRVLFDPESKWSKAYYGICHFGNCIFAVTPIDHPKALTLTTIRVSPTEDYCERAYSCLNFKCPLNKFDKDVFAGEFKDMGTFTLGLPHKIIGKLENPWWCEEPYYSKWKDFKLSPEGGRLEHKDFKGNEEL